MVCCLDNVIERESGGQVGGKRLGGGCRGDGREVGGEEVSFTFGEVDPQVVQLVSASEPQEKCPTTLS